MLYTFDYNMYKNVIDYSFQWCTCCVVCHCLRVMLITGRQPPQTGEVMPDFQQVTSRLRLRRHRCMFASGWSHTRIWGVTKLVSEHGLEVDDSTRVHLEADLLSVTDVIMGQKLRGDLITLILMFVLQRKNAPGIEKTGQARGTIRGISRPSFYGTSKSRVRRVRSGCWIYWWVSSGQQS